MVTLQVSKYIIITLVLAVLCTEEKYLCFPANYFPSNILTPSQLASSHAHAHLPLLHFVRAYVHTLKPGQLYSSWHIQQFEGQLNLRGEIDIVRAGKKSERGKNVSLFSKLSYTQQQHGYTGVKPGKCIRRLDLLLLLYYYHYTTCTLAKVKTIVHTPSYGLNPASSFTTTQAYVYVRVAQLPGTCSYTRYMIYLRKFLRVREMELACYTSTVYLGSI